MKIKNKFDPLCFKYFNTYFNDNKIRLVEAEVHTLNISGFLKYQTISLEEIKNILDNFCYPISEYNLKIAMEIWFSCENEEQYKIEVREEYDEIKHEFTGGCEAYVYRYIHTLNKWEKVIDGYKIKSN
ncbi:MAG: hypothetical protein GX660_26280 [Clostridiaceae bacterium]|nr:hypothetical protein [Clostridiaceae bacterium]